jgi:hypothetical protein
MVSKIAIGLAAAAIAMAGATSGTSAQVAPGVGNQPPGQQPQGNARDQAEPRQQPQGNARDQAEPRQRGVRDQAEPRLRGGRRSERDRGVVVERFGGGERGRRGVNINLGGMGREREAGREIREERGREGSRVNIHLGQLAAIPATARPLIEGSSYTTTPSASRPFIEGSSNTATP